MSKISDQTRFESAAIESRKWRQFARRAAKLAGDLHLTAGCFGIFPNAAAISHDAADGISDATRAIRDAHTMAASAAIARAAILLTGNGGDMATTPASLPDAAEIVRQLAGAV